MILFVIFHRVVIKDFDHLGIRVKGQKMSVPIGKVIILCLLQEPELFRNNNDRDSGIWQSFFYENGSSPTGT